MRAERGCTLFLAERFHGDLFGLFGEDAASHDLFLKLENAIEERLSEAEPL